MSGKCAAHGGKTPLNTISCCGRATGEPEIKERFAIETYEQIRAGAKQKENISSLGVGGGAGCAQSGKLTQLRLPFMSR